MQRAMVVLEGKGPVDKSSIYPPYDHPFFGQVFLASVFRAIGYPHPFIGPLAKGDVHSIEMLYLVPRILMGILAVIDTFLVYKICERKYSNDRGIAFIASVLFAVMPMTWLLRMTMLESIQLPFILLAVLFAIYIKGSKDNKKHKSTLMALISGIFVGLAVLTKMPAIAIIPLVGFLVYTNSRDLKILGLWFIPVMAIPLIWPIYAFSIGDLKYWLEGLYLQTHRGEIVYRPVPLLTSIKYLFEIDPILIILGSGAVVFAAIKRDFFLLLWSVPLLIFFYFIHSQFFLLTTILPAFCIAAAKMINNLSTIIMSKKFRYIMSLSTFSAIAIFGLVSITYLITTNLNSDYFQASAFVAKFLSYNYDEDGNNNDKKKIAVVGQDRYYWIPQKVLQEDQYYKVWDGIHFAKYEKAENVLLVIDDPAKYWLTSHSQDRTNENVRMLQTLYDNTFPVGLFEKNKYSSSIGDWNHIDGQYTSKIEIRTNRTDDMLLNSSSFIVKLRNGTVIKDGSKLEIFIPVTQIAMPSYWNDSLGNCDYAFKCTSNVTTAWKGTDNNKTSFQLSTNTTNKNIWSSIYGNQINVKPGQKYQITTHMQLNRYATQSHIAVEGYNQTSKTWNQFNSQCPSGINGPLEWHEYSCELTIPKDVDKIRPVLNAGWSSQPGKQAVTLFDSIYLSEKSPIETTHTNIITNNNNLVSNPDFIDFIKGRIESLCQFRRDFDVQVSYKLLTESRPPNLVRLSLIAENDNITGGNPIIARQQITLDSMNSPDQAIGIHSSKSSSTANLTSSAFGKLRMIRSGSNIEGYYYSFGKWIPMYFGHINPVDVNLILQINTGGVFVQQPVKIAFDDHIVNKGHVVNCIIN